MEKTIGAFEARRSLGKLIEEAFYKNDAFIIERSGRPMAVIVSVEDYEKWQRQAKDRLFALVDKARKGAAGVPAETVERDVRAAVRATRAKPRRSKAAAR
ncbi:MAG: type II toxin-antitoxin system Phd/YefM family antitoxin [Chloroflexi bacterium]|nr:type II toxin-antitoxin system Phd/YefM family antitoxin [Chloroflexota bacterium]